VALVALVPLAATWPALLSLGVLAGLLTALNVYESLHFAASRDQIRHGEHDAEHA